MPADGVLSLVRTRPASEPLVLALERLQDVLQDRYGMHGAAVMQIEHRLLQSYHVAFRAKDVHNERAVKQRTDSSTLHKRVDIMGAAMSVSALLGSVARQGTFT